MVKQFPLIIFLVGLVNLSPLYALDQAYITNTKGRRIHTFEIGVALGKVVGNCTIKETQGLISSLKQMKKLVDTVRSLTAQKANKALYSSLRNLSIGLPKQAKYVKKEKGAKLDKRLKKIQKKAAKAWKKSYKQLMKRRVKKNKIVFHPLIPNEFTLGFFVGQGLVNPKLLSKKVHAKQLKGMINFASKAKDKLSKGSISVMKKLMKSIGNESSTQQASNGVLSYYKY